MRSLSALSCAALLAIPTTAFTIKKRSPSAAPKVIQHEIQRRDVSDPIGYDRLRRRGNTISAALANEETLYFIDCSLGTPAQSLRLHIDTGSSDLWTNVATSQLCEYRDEGLCTASGTYNPNKSSTYQYVNSDFRISYADNSGASGIYATDTLEIGGATLNNQQFGIGYSSTSQQGILGIGYPTNEAAVAVQGAGEYVNVPWKMMQDGLINTVAYSLWLNDLDASTGSILFGGVNSDKYTGSLEVLPIIPSYNIYSAFYIALTAVGANGTAGSIAKDVDTAVLLDSGSSLTYLPNSIVTTIYNNLGLTYDEQEGAAFINCDRASDSQSIEYTLSSPTISVTMSELVIPIGEENGRDICIFGIAPAEGSTCVLGDTFLRSAYVVYDISDNKIAIAQTNFNSTTDNIQEITNSTSSSTGIPDATVVSNAVTSVASNPSGGARNGFGGTSSSSAARPTAPPGLLSGMAAAGLMVAGAVLL